MLDTPRGIEAADTVHMIEPPFGAGWFSTRNRALRFRLVKNGRSLPA
jgi:hypothetical protein